MLKFWKLCLHKLALQKHSLVLNNFDSVKVRKILGSNKKDLIQYVSSLFQGFILLITTYYSMIVSTTPAPTVLPPSRIANLIPCSIATGAINSTVITTLSPGITI